MPAHDNDYIEGHKTFEVCMTAAVKLYQQIIIIIIITIAQCPCTPPSTAEKSAPRLAPVYRGGGGGGGGGGFTEQGVVTTAPPYSHLRPGSQSGRHRVTRVFHSSVTGHIQEYGEGSSHGHNCTLPSRGQKQGNQLLA